MTPKPRADQVQAIEQIFPKRTVDTGAAAWTWRLGVEAILGLYPEEGGLRFDPCIPPEWPGFEATLHVSGREVHVVVENPARISRGIDQLVVDGVEAKSALVCFTGTPGTKHEVHIVLGNSGARYAQGPKEPTAVSVATSPPL